MKRLLISGFVSVGLLTGTVSVFAPVSFGAPEPVSSSCTAEQIDALKTDITSLRTQIIAARLSPAQRAARIAARKTAIAALRQQARGSSWDPAAIAAAKAALATAKDALSHATDEGARAALRLQIKALQDQLAGARGTALTEEQKTLLTSQIDALIAADKADNQARQLGEITLRQRLLGNRTQLSACRA